MVPHLSCILVLDPTRPCLIPMVKNKVCEQVLGVLSAKQISKVGKDELYLATLLGG